MRSEALERISERITFTSKLKSLSVAFFVNMKNVVGVLYAWPKVCSMALLTFVEAFVPPTTLSNLAA